MENGYEKLAKRTLALDRNMQVTQLVTSEDKIALKNKIMGLQVFTQIMENGYKKLAERTLNLENNLQAIQIVTK